MEQKAIERLKQKLEFQRDETRQFLRLVELEAFLVGSRKASRHMCLGKLTSRRSPSDEA